MPLQSSPASMSLSDIYQNINETDDVMPSGGTNVSLHTLSETMENASSIGPTSRVDISADPRAFSEFYGYHYPGGYSGLGNVLYLGDPTTTTLTNNTLVEGEDLGVYFEHYDQDDGHETVVSIVTNAGVAATGDDTSATFTQDDDEYGDDSIGSVLLTVGSYEGATMKVKVVDDDNAYDSNILSNTFTYRDSVVGHGVTTLTNSVGGSGYTSTTVDASDESVNNVIVTATVTTGTQASATYGVANLVAGDGGTMGASAGAEDWTISNTPGKIRFTSTHNGYGVSVGRNQTTSTADFDVTYARAIDDISRNASTFNSGDVVTISATGEGVSGTHTMRLGYHKTEANDTFTASTDESVLESLYLRQGETENFTLTSTTGTALKTYYPKALYTVGVTSRVTGTAFTLAPAYSYSTTGNTTINVSTTQAFAVSSVVGNGSSVAITSSPNIGSGTNSATMTPLLKTGTFTITFTGTANYTQTSNTTDILSVDPTVSLVLTDDTVSTLFPINDAHSDTITSGTHGVSPTTFTHTPTVVGTLQNGNALTYLWTAASSNFTYTSGGTSTVGAVSFKKNSSGTLAHGLTVTGDDDRDDDDENDIVCVSVTKTVSGATSDVFRIGTTFTITSISTAYTQTVALYRFNALDQWVKIAQGVSVASTINFSMTGLGWVADATARPVRLVDDDNTGVYDALGNFAILNPLPTISSFTATASTTIGQINLAWSITGASGGSVNITVNTGADPGSQSTANTDSTTVTGLGNNLTRTYTLTVANANSESVTDADSATTITPTLTFGDPSYDEWDWGDTGDVAIIATKNFADALTGHMGYSLDATATGGTELQTLSSQGAGSTGDITLTFDKNDWNYQSSLGSAITDFRAGNAAASWIVSNNSATVSDFSQPNDATSFSAIGSSATGIQISWTNPTGTYTGVKLYGGVQGDPESLLATVTAGQTPSFSHTSLSQGTTYAYYLQAYYSKTANGVTRTNTNNSTTFTGTTISWDSVSVAGLVMLASSGVGWNDGTSPPTSGQEDAHLQATGTTMTLYFLDSTTLGTHTVSMRRSIDGATWNGTNDWYGDSESNDVFYIETGGNVDPANFHLSANVKPDPPINGTATANSSSQITLTWSCSSAIETGFKIFRSTSAYPDSSGTPINSPSANAISYVNTGLDGNEQYYYSIYSYRGSTVSSVRATATATTWASTTWGTQPFTAPADFGITGIPFQTVTSPVKSITITGADTSSNGTTVSCTNGIKVALSLSSASGYSSYGTSKTITIPNATDILYAKYQHTFTKAGTNPSTSDVTYANGGVNFTDLDILITEEGV